MKNLCKDCEYYEFIEDSAKVDRDKHICYYTTIDPVTGTRNPSAVTCADARSVGHCGISGKHFSNKKQLLTE